MITLSSIITASVIFFARVCDVSLGTFRHVMVIRGKKSIAFGLAFVESLIWVYAVSRVLTQISDPVTAFAFALGFATGTYVGITIEGFFKIGEQAVRIFTSYGKELAPLIREKGYRVTVFDGNGRDGPVTMLFVQIKRRGTRKIVTLARDIDPACFIVVDDVTDISAARLPIGK
ncbi:MAG TPA: DUF2179 domain-containing protein [Treponema sp.]|nr:DUF2179 domain-containing protein [Treponema sp.]